MNKISARIIADSLNPMGIRLTTMVVVFPRMILSEFNTHRVFSRNSASSRAIPFNKMIKLVNEEPFIPMSFMKEHKGMQGNEYFTEEKDIQELTKNWLIARDKAIESATTLSEQGLTKQLCNRILEPFMYHTVIVTATEWNNFLNLRMDSGAEIHIQELARQMYKALQESTPKQLQDNEWHIPFGEMMDINRINDTALKMLSTEEEMRLKIATARCARVSYLNFEGKDDYTADYILHDSLASSGHFSPMEHCALAIDNDELILENGNLRGFIQYRKTFENENRNDQPKL
jgi:thymidylate synthase ThyX